MKQPTCPICSLDLMSNEGYKTEMVDGKEVKTLVEEQVSYWMHDPKNLHADVQVVAHKACYDKVKAVVTYKNFDKPTQDYAIAKYPVLKDGVVSAKTVAEFTALTKPTK